MQTRTGPPRYLKVKNDILLLYLKGIRGLFESKLHISKYYDLNPLLHRKKYPYNFFNHLAIICASIYAYKWFKHQLENVHLITSY